MSRTDSPRVAILGAGPVGLEAALYAARLERPFRVYERGKVGDNLRRWGHVKLFTPFGMNVTPLGRAILSQQPTDGDVLTGREHVAAYLEPLARSALLTAHLNCDTTVLGIGRTAPTQPFRLLVRDSKGKERIDEADVVLDCSGSYGNGRWLGDGGLPALGELAGRAHFACGLEDVLGEKTTHYADRTTLVVGSGHSAATTVCQLAQLAQKHPSTWIIWLARSSDSQPIKRIVNDPLRERDLLASKANMLATRGEGHVEFHPGAVVESVEGQGKDGFLVTARVGGSSRTWEVDRILANVGYAPTQRLHDCLATAEPGYHVLGVKSASRGASFLLRMGFDQVREAFAVLTGKPSLDLYRAAR